MNGICKRYDDWIKNVGQYCPICNSSYNWKKRYLTKIWECNRCGTTCREYEEGGGFVCVPAITAAFCKLVGKTEMLDMVQPDDEFEPSCL